MTRLADGAGPNSQYFVYSASGRTTLDDEVPGWLPPGGQHFQPGLVRELSEFSHGTMFASTQHHFYHQASSRFIYRNAAEDHNATIWARRLGATAQDGQRFRVGPVVQDSLQHIEVRPGWQRVEEALSDRRDAL